MSMAVIRSTGDSIERLDVAQTSSQSDLYLDAAAMLAGKLLHEDAGASEVDHPGEPWSLDRFRATIDRGEAAISVGDLQGRFNLNLLLRHDPLAEIGVFAALSEGTRVNAAAMAAILAHYQAERSSNTPHGRRRGALYANVELAVVAELAELPGVTGHDLDALLPVVALLPQEALVNANTASPDILAALLGVSDDSQLRALDELRQHRPFGDIADLRAAVTQVFGPEVANRIPSQLVSFASSWFEVLAEVELQETRKSASYVLYRDPETAAVFVVARVAEDL
jgi:general secretion pathway protein K